MRNQIVMLGCMAALLALPAHGGAAEPAQGDAAKGKAVSGTCQSCHGADGNKTMGTVIPKLAGQIAPYIDKQLHDFKSGERKNSIMSSMAAGLSDADMKDVAAYFSSRTIVPDDSAPPALADAGKKIYEGGIADAAVPACSACHGPQGAGVTPLYPRLAGQHADYLALQLHNFKAGGRANDPNGVMRDIAAKLTDKQIEAVAAYLSAFR